MTYLASTLPILASVSLLALALAYGLIVSAWSVGIRRVLSGRGRDTVRQNGHTPRISVIVPARDEADTIEACLRSILACDYPREAFEVIVVDDLSRDATPDVVRRVMRDLVALDVPVVAGAEDEPGGDAAATRLQLLQMSESLERTRAHKKRAIAAGVVRARGSIILTTDADCVVPPGWIREMAARFTDDVALVSGPVLYRAEGSLMRRVQALEFLGLVAVGAGAIGCGRPNLCNGANVAYRKDVFSAVGGFSGIDHLASGDDELLMQKIAYTTPWSVWFCQSSGAAVVTVGAPSVTAFLSQRKRWASKGRHYPHGHLRATIAVIYLFYVALLVAPVALLAGVITPGVVGAALGLKVVAEAALLWPVCRHFDRRSLMGYFLPAQVAHVPYIVAMGAAGAIGGYTWKGRQIAR